jgi:uncharacterized membrane protein YdjX (TVP38/TMEM64 family)
MARKMVAILPCALILLFILIFYLTEGLHVFNFDMIQQEHIKWKAFVHENPVLSAVYFMGIYIVSVILVLPDSTFLTLLGGFLFPMPLAIAYACISETIGAVIFFWAIKLAYVETLGKRKNHPLHKIQVKIHDDQACYLLFFRFSHLLPFWLINVGAGVFRLRTFTFIWTTVLGILPLTFFLVEGAESLSKYFETHTHFKLKELFTLQLKISLIALGCFALLPVLYKKFKSKKNSNS